MPIDRQPSAKQKARSIRFGLWRDKAPYFYGKTWGGVALLKLQLGAVPNVLTV